MIPETPATVFNGSLHESFGCRVNLHILHHTPFTGVEKTRTGYYLKEFPCTGKPGPGPV